MLADWLQERSHPWGELIAVQSAIAHRTEPTEERARLLRREHELVRTRHDWWPYDGVGSHVESFARGFPSRIRAKNVAGLRTLVSRMPWLAADDIEVILEESSMLGLVGLGRLPTRGFTLVAGSNDYFDLLDAKMLVHFIHSRSRGSAASVARALRRGARGADARGRAPPHFRRSTPRERFAVVRTC